LTAGLSAVWRAALGLVLCPIAAAAFDLQGHRGARGLAPENTMAAFERALGIGVTTLETDLGVTADGVLVLSHDPMLNPDLTRGPDGRWLTAPGRRIREIKFADLRRYDVGRLNPASQAAGEWPEQVPADGQAVPSFDELARHVAGRPVRLNIETKVRPDRPEETVDPATFARLVAEAVTRHRLEDRTTVQSFDWRTLIEVRKLVPGLRTSCLTTQTERTNTVADREGQASPWTAGLSLASHGGSVPRLVIAAGCSIWSPNWRSLTKAHVEEARRLGLKVVPWTVNRPEDMKSLIVMGVDGLITDYPDRGRRVVREAGLAVD
jgi:glycerophosphoryl diester phosphodiesterase